MSPTGTPRHAILRRLSVSFGANRCLISRPPGRIHEFAAWLPGEGQAALTRLGDPFTDDLPGGAIHADYFPDNVLFEDGAVSAVIDFYFGCDGAFAYDLAIALSAWGFDAEGRPMPEALAAFQCGYEAVRPLSAAERAASTAAALCSR